MNERFISLCVDVNCSRVVSVLQKVSNSSLYINYIDRLCLNSIATSIDVLPFKNQALCEFCTRVNQLKHC